MTNLRELLARTIYAANSFAWWETQPKDFSDLPPPVRRDLYAEASAIIAALKANGLVVVPREATGDMSMKAIDFDMNETCKPLWKDVWATMLSYSPHTKEFE